MQVRHWSIFICFKIKLYEDRVWKLNCEIGFFVPSTLHQNCLDKSLIRQLVRQSCIKFTMLYIKCRFSCGESKLYRNAVNCQNILARIVDIWSIHLHFLKISNCFGLHIRTGQANKTGNHRNTRKSCEICSKLSIKAPKICSKLT